MKKSTDKKLNEFKIQFENWSGFSFKSDNLIDSLKEIKDIQYQLECEICDRASILKNRINKIFQAMEED